MIVGAALLLIKIPIPFESIEEFKIEAVEFVPTRTPPIVLLEIVHESTIKLNDKFAKIAYPAFCFRIELEIRGCDIRGSIPFLELNRMMELEIFILGAPA